MSLLPAVVGLLATPLGQLLVGLVVIAIVIILGRIVLNIAWKLVLIAAVVVGILFAVTNLPL